MSLRYLTVADVVALHSFILGRMSQPPAALRNEGALASALARPRMAAHYGGADLVRQGVLLAAGVAEAQAFVDGNKRAALAALDAFWRLNGLVFEPEPLEWARQIEALGARQASRDEATDAFERWVRERLPPGGAPEQDPTASGAH
jgi:death on curing protein